MDFSSWYLLILNRRNTRNYWNPELNTRTLVRTLMLASLWLSLTNSFGAVNWKGNNELKEWNEKQTADSIQTEYLTKFKAGSLARWQHSRSYAWWPSSVDFLARRTKRIRWKTAVKKKKRFYPIPIGRVDDDAFGLVNNENVQIFVSAVFIWLFYQYLYKRNPFCFCFKFELFSDAAMPFLFLP